jgi:hypothetical protein
MQRKRILAMVAGALGVAALAPVATVFGDDSGDGGGRSIEAVTALSTAITYQGRLTDGGSPANGVYDLRFILYDAETGGAQVGSTVAAEDVTVTNGLFSTSLDFGAGAFNGDARWVEIAVRPGSGSGSSGYTVLSPRQPVSPTPYALYAVAAGSLAVPFTATGSSAGAPSTAEGLITVEQSGTGIAIAGNRTSTDAAQYPAVLGMNAGGGAGVQGETTNDTGLGVAGFATGTAGNGGYFWGPTGLKAVASTSAGVALEVDGAVKVSGSNPAAFVHTTTTANMTVPACAGHCTAIDSPLTNGDPNAILIVTARFNEGASVSGVYNGKVVGVWYEPGLTKWVIFNEDLTAMPLGAKYNVLVIKK